jgi:hypothetical protein
MVETVANWVADTFLTSPLCEPARNRFGVQAGNTIIDLNRVIGQSYLLIVSNQNYYEGLAVSDLLDHEPGQLPGIGQNGVAEFDAKSPSQQRDAAPRARANRGAGQGTNDTGALLGAHGVLDIGHKRAQTPSSAAAAA